MIYKFKSRATGDLIMLGPHGDQTLRLIGREPAAQGIVEPDAMPAALAALSAAIEADEALQRAPAAEGHADSQADSQADPDKTAARVGLRQRLWPMIEMLRRCQAAQEPVVWGV